jgi:omega-6 fatty acid desaturase (delta-12 desaturase)
VAIFLLSAASYGVAFVGVVALPWWPARLACSVLLGLMVCSLLLVGHDAAHDSLTPRPWLNAVLGRLALLPTLHPYTMWKLSHNRMHHAFTNLRGYDHFWAPLSLEAFRALPWHRRLMQRAYRTLPGLGLYTLIECWWRHSVLRRGCEGLKVRYGFAGTLDQLCVLAFLACEGAALLLVNRIVADAWGVPALSAGVALTLGFLLPCLVATWVSGLCTFLHHTHPRVRWYDDRAEWSFYKGAVEGTVHVVFPWPVNRVLHNLMEHTAHHVDTKVPLYNLATGQGELEAANHDIISEQFSLRYLLRTLATCRLYDYRNHRWLDFDGNPTT